eukprot:2699299-Pyramimonas_sp.AAC.2
MCRRCCALLIISLLPPEQQGGVLARCRARHCPHHGRPGAVPALLTNKLIAHVSPLDWLEYARVIARLVGAYTCRC